MNKSLKFRHQSHSTPLPYNVGKPTLADHHNRDFYFDCEIDRISNICIALVNGVIASPTRQSTLLENIRQLFTGQRNCT
jgi:hypothetical protein